VTPRIATLVAAAALLAPVTACDSGEEKFVAEPTLDKPCVRPGESQTINLKTSAGANYAYAITYPNGTAEGKPPAGTVPSSGKVAGTWPIPAGLPDGTIKVMVLVSYREHTAQPELTFKVSSSGVCP
jgi:hypothetical protein